MGGELDHSENWMILYHQNIFIILIPRMKINIKQQIQGKQNSCPPYGDYFSFKLDLKYLDLGNENI